MSSSQVLGDSPPAAPLAQPVWVSEHFWPGTAEELVFAQAQRLTSVPGCVDVVVLSGQQLVIGCFRGDERDVTRALAASGLAATVRPGWQLQPPSVRPIAPAPPTPSP
jgi:hypothetical protein